jgi:hypothetical protein
MEEGLGKFLKEIIKDIGKKYLDQELDKLVVLGKIKPEDKLKIVNNIELGILSSDIEDISERYRAAPAPTTTGDIIASEFSVMFEVEDVLEAWKQNHLDPAVEAVLEDKERG